MSAVTREETRREIGTETERVVHIPLEPLAWAAAAAIFVLIRLWPIWQMPVGGAELAHLSGAWNASIGVDDERYVPTLFQAVVALLFNVTTSEVPARVLAFAATATLPLAIYLLRPVLGAGGALLALVLASLDAVLLAVGAGASALGFDVAIAAWLFVFLVRGGLPSWAWAAAAFVVAASGSLSLPLVVAVVATVLMRRETIDWRLAGWISGSVVLAIILTTLRPGLGPDGPTIAPVQVFGDGFTERWSTADGWNLLVLAAWPIVAAGLAGAAWRCIEAWRDGELDRRDQLLLLWGAFALGWFVASLPSHDPAAVAGLTLPMALLGGPVIARACVAMWHAEWRYARYAVPVAAVALVFIAFHLGRWADDDRVGNAGEKLLMAGLALALLAAVGFIAADRGAFPALFALVLPVGLVPLVVATSVVAFRAGDSPLPSPMESPQARQLRDIALETRGDGAIVIHPDYAEALTWPFRDSGNVIVASRLPEDAGFVLWPPSAPAPAGFEVLAGDWSLTREVRPPTAGIFELMRWYIDRYSLSVRPEPVTVYVREGE